MALGNGDKLGADEDAVAGADSEIARRLNRLFEVFHKPNEPPLSNAAAAAAITEKTGVSISAAYIWQLRTGKATNPSLGHLKALAEFFGIEPSYLLDDDVDPKIESQLELLQLLRDEGVRDLALRASGLTPGAIDSIRAMVDHVRKLEKLPPVISPEPEE